MNTKIFLILICLSLGLKASAQSLYTAIDWNMTAVVSSNDYTNGSSDGAPGITLGASFGFGAIETFYKRYKLEQTVENSSGETDVLFEDNIFGIGAKLNHNIFFLSRFGILIHDIETSAVNSKGKSVRFAYDGNHVGFYFGGGIQLPFADDFFFHSSVNLETSTTDLTNIGMFVGLRYHFLNF